MFRLNKPIVVIIRAQGKRSPLDLQELVNYCHIIVLNLLKPIVDKNVLSIAGRHSTCDVAVFTSSLPCYIMYKYGLSVKARYYIAIGEDTRDALFYLMNVPRDSIMLPSRYTSKHIVELLRHLIESDKSIRIVHVYRSKHADTSIIVSSQLFPRRVVVREFKIYKLVLDEKLLDLAEKALQNAQIIVILSSLPISILQPYLSRISVPIIVPSVRVKRKLEQFYRNKIYVLENVTKKELIEKIKLALRENAEQS